MDVYGRWQLKLYFYRRSSCISSSHTPIQLAWTFAGIRIRLVQIPFLLFKARKALDQRGTRGTLRAGFAASKRCRCARNSSNRLSQ